MKLVRKRRPTSIAQLKPHQRRQLVKLQEGKPTSAARCLAALASSLELWDIEEDATVRYEVWFFGGDAGVVFAAKKTKPIALVIQCGLECDAWPLRKQLADAIIKVKPGWSPTMKEQRPPSNDKPLAIGARVRHQTFGVGVVEVCNGRGPDATVCVRFSGARPPAAPTWPLVLVSVRSVAARRLPCEDGA